MPTIDLPKSLREWFDIALVLGAIGMAFFFSELRAAMDDHNNEVQSHPQLHALMSQNSSQLNALVESNASQLKILRAEIAGKEALNTEILRQMQEDRRETINAIKELERTVKSLHGVP